MTRSFCIPLMYAGGIVIAMGVGVLYGATLSGAVAHSIFWGGAAFYLACQIAAGLINRLDHKRFMREMADAETRLNAATAEFERTTGAARDDPGPVKAIDERNAP